MHIQLQLSKQLETIQAFLAVASKCILLMLTLIKTLRVQVSNAPAIDIGYLWSVGDSP